MIKVVKNPAEYQCTFLIDFLYVSTGTLPLSIFASKSVNVSVPVDFKCVTFSGCRSKELADFMGYSTFYISRKFMDLYGIPITAYVRLRKLQYSI